MKHVFAILLTVSFIAAFMPRTALGYESAFERTPVGEFAVRELPAGRQLVASESGSYFDQNDSLFRRLFNYIKDNEVSMTVPVEGALDRAEMRFYVGQSISGDLPNASDVNVSTVSTRLVASLGARGSYRESNVNTAREKLEAWVASQEGLSRAGEPYAVFWNGPFMPPFLRRFEVHLPVTR